MNNKLFRDFDYVVGNDSVSNKEIKVKVIFIYQGARTITLPLVLKKVKGKDKTYYSNEAKKIIDKMIKDGSLKKYCDNYIKRKRTRYVLIALACLLAITCIGVVFYFVFKDKPTPPTPTTYSISMVTEGTDIESKSLPTDKAYKGTISVTAENKILDGLTLVTLKDSNTNITTYCDYDPMQDNKSASLEIPLEYLTNDIEVTVALVDKPEPPITPYHISMLTEGTDIEEKELPTDENYLGTITVTNEDKILNGLTSVTLKDGEDTDITTHCTYNPAQDNKSASLEIPLDYLTNDIEVTVTLIDEPPVTEYSISMKTEGATISPTTMNASEEYSGTITVTNSSKILDVAGALKSVKLKTSEEDITSYCTDYDPSDDYKSATFTIPADYIVDDIEVEVALIDDDPHRKEELTFTCETAGSLGIYYHSSYNIKGGEPPIRDNGINVSYKIGDEEGWHDVTIEQHFTSRPGEHHKEYVLANLTAGQEIRIRGNNEYWSYKNEEYPVVCDECLTFFTNGGKFKVSNNVMSLLDSEDFATLNEATDYGFRYLFSYNDACNANISDASNLYLPTNLADSCFESMFQGNKNLTKAPKLPATDLYDSCYWYMFEGCTSLTEAPAVLPAETLADYCYNNMFANCTALVTAPQIKATELAYNCCEEMFLGCKTLTNAPTLSAETLECDCYNSMFEGCTSLVNAPALPAEDLTYYDYCYYEMFSGCIALKKAPELRATTLADSCYAFMFNGCTALEKAPKLPAETLVDDCYNSMFKGCTSLIDLPELKATELVSGCYYEMFSGCTAIMVMENQPSYIGKLIFKCPEIPEEAYTNPVENMFGGGVTAPRPTPITGVEYRYMEIPEL